jgi:hypothetical protein
MRHIWEGAKIRIKIVAGKAEREKISRRKWENNIKMDLIRSQWSNGRVLAI